MHCWATFVDDDEQPIDNAVRPCARAGAAICSREYLKALAEREHLKLEVATSFAHTDALLAPVTMTPTIPKSLVTVMSLGLSKRSTTGRSSGHSGNPALRRLSM